MASKYGYGPAFAENVKELYRKYGSIYKVAEELGVNHKTVSRYAKELIPDERRKGSRIRYSQKTKDKAKRLYKELGSIYKVSDRIKIPNWTVHDWVRGMAKDYSNYGKFKYKKKKARKLYKKVKNIYKVAEEFGVAPATVSNWVRGLVPIARTKYERKVAKFLDAGKIPYDKIVLKGRFRNYTPDFVIPPTNPKIFIEVKENNRKHYQQWHRVCMLCSKEMAFDVVDIKSVYPKIFAIAVINKKWGGTSMKVLETYFDKVFVGKELAKLESYITKKLQE